MMPATTAKIAAASGSVINSSTQLEALAGPMYDAYTRPANWMQQHNNNFYGRPNRQMVHRGGNYRKDPFPMRSSRYDYRDNYRRPSRYGYNNGMMSYRRPMLRNNMRNNVYYNGPMSRNYNYNSRRYGMTDDYGYGGYGRNSYNNDYYNTNNDYYYNGNNNMQRTTMRYNPSLMGRSGPYNSNRNIMGANTGYNLPYEYGMNYDKRANYRSFNDAFSGHHMLQSRARFGPSHRNLVNNNSAQRWNNLAQEYGMDYESSAGTRGRYNNGNYGNNNGYYGNNNGYYNANTNGYGSDRRMNRFRSMPIGGQNLARSPYSSLGLTASGGTYNGNVDWSGLASEYGMSPTRY